MKIFKYQLDSGIIDEVQRIRMPQGSVVLDAQCCTLPTINNVWVINVWAEVNPEAPVVDRAFHIAFTGADRPSSPHQSWKWKHVRTLSHEGFVFHVYVYQEQENLVAQWRV
jgi:hypothetical protein